MQHNRIKILSSPLDIVSWEDVINRCQMFLQNGTHHIVTLNGEIALEAEKNIDLQTAINNAELVIADSTNIVWAAKIKGARGVSTTPGSDLLIKLSQLAAREDKSIYLLGGFDNTAEKAAASLQKNFPTLKIAGHSNKNPDDASAITDIRHSQANIVFVAYGAPKQEIWIASNGIESGANILVGVGGAFDMISGKLPRAPRIFRLLHLEWLWRLILQPTRIGRIWKALVVFPLRVLFSH